MTSVAQIQANRRNAQKSTGPKTPEGRQKAAQNSLKHGLTARQALVSGEDAAAFERHQTDLLAELAPIGRLETYIADRIVTLSWRLSRTGCIQSGTLNTLKEKLENPSPIDKLINSTTCGLRTKDSGLQTDLRTEDYGLKTDLTLGKIAIKDFSDARVLDRLLMYERRTEHSLYRSILQYQNLKYARKQVQREQMALMDLD